MQQGNDVEAAWVSQEIQFCLLHWGDDLQDTQRRSHRQAKVSLQMCRFLAVERSV